MVEEKSIANKKGMKIKKTNFKLDFSTPLSIGELKKGPTSIRTQRLPSLTKKDEVKNLKLASAVETVNERPKSKHEGVRFFAASV